MEKEIDLAVLSTALRAVDAGKAFDADAYGPLNEYMEDDLIPAIMRGEVPLLSEIRFDLFDLDHVTSMLDYLESRKKAESELEAINAKLCNVKPAYITSRTFC